MTSKRDQSQGPAASRIPDFQTREEEAEFWDTHDFTEFLDETWPVTLRVRRPLSEGLTVRLDRQDREEIERRATAQGIGPSTLVRMWIKDRLRQPSGHSTTS
jgi:predicted DNA binding CopG/RHH family protein